MATIAVMRPGFRVAAVVTGLVILWISIGIARWPRTDIIPVPAPTVVVVLSSSATSDSTLEASGAARLAAGIELARRWNARLVTTRARGQRPGLTTEGAERRMIASAGLEARWSIEPGVVRSTREEAIELGRTIQPGSRIGLVTSRLHTRRACATFERAGFVVTCVGAPEPWWLVPYSFVYEQLATVKYRVNGWI